MNSLSKELEEKLALLHAQKAAQWPDGNAEEVAQQVWNAAADALTTESGSNLTAFLHFPASTREFRNLLWDWMADFFGEPALIKAMRGHSKRPLNAHHLTFLTGRAVMQNNPVKVSTFANQFAQLGFDDVLDHGVSIIAFAFQDSKPKLGMLLAQKILPACVNNRFADIPQYTATESMADSFCETIILATFPETQALCNLLTDNIPYQVSRLLRQAAIRIIKATGSDEHHKKLNYLIVHLSSDSVLRDPVDNTSIHPLAEEDTINTLFDSISTETLLSFPDSHKFLFGLVAKSFVHRYADTCDIYNEILCNHSMAQWKKDIFLTLT